MRKVFGGYRIERTLLYVLFLFFLISCTPDKETYVGHFPVEMKLKGEAVVKMKVYPDIVSISYVGDKYLCRRRGRYFYTLFSAGFDSITSLAPKGHGKDEFLAPLYCGQYGEDHILLLDRPKCTLYRVAITDLRQRQSVAKIPSSFGVEPRFLFQVGKDKYLGADDHKGCPVFTFSSADEFIDTKVQPDVLPSGSVDSELCENIAVYSASQRKMAVAYFNLPVLCFRDAEGTIVKTILVDNVSSIQKNGMGGEYFTCICATPKYVYALYAGSGEIAKKGRQSVMVFDWNGQPKAKYQIDAALYLAVDENDRCLIAINEYNGKVIRYILPVGI